MSKKTNLLAGVLFALLSPSLYGATFQVTTNSDAGAGSLRQAILDANVSPNSTIQVNSGLGIITLTSSLPPISANMQITGPTASQIIEGAFSSQPFVITNNAIVSISNVSVQHAASIGGAGATGSGGGGGALGAGGAVFAQEGTQVTLQNVSFTGCAAKGGAGGSGLQNSVTDIQGGGGGGGFGKGTGGSGADGSLSGGGGGGGGYAGHGGDGGVGNSTTLIGGGGGGGGGLGSVTTGGTGGAGSSTVGGPGGGGGGGGSDSAPGSAGDNNGNGGNGANGTSGSGGNGGTSSSPNGGSPVVGNGGGGGGGGPTSASVAGGNGGSALLGGGGGGGIHLANAGINAGNGGSSSGNFGGGGGGGSAGSAGSNAGGNGGSGGFLAGGGGGGSGGDLAGSMSSGGTGGYGGGGGGGGSAAFGGASTGSFGGDGGFGAGGAGAGAGSTISGATAFGGGAGGISSTGLGGGGGGGAGLGGALFLGQNGQITLKDSVSFVSNNVTGGTGATGGTNGGNGQALGADVFMASTSTLTLQNSSAMTLNGIASNQGFNEVSGADSVTTGGLIATGTGLVTIQGANTYTGSTTIKNGAKVSITSDANLGSTSGGAGSLIFNSGTLETVTSVVSSRNVQLTGNGTIQADATAIDSFSGLFSGSGNFIKTGSGTLALTNPVANTYTGNTSINGGIMQIARDNLLGTSSGSISFNGGTLELTAAINSSRNINLAGAGTIQTDVSTNNFSGLISGSGSLKKSGPGTLILSNTGSNTYSGGTSVLGGVLQISNDNLLGSSLGSLALNNATLEITGTTTSTRKVSLSGASIMQIDSGTSTFSGAFSGTGSLTKTGAGILYLNNASANSYQGGTIVNAGTLKISHDNNLGSGSLAFNSSSFEMTDGVSSARSIAITGPVNFISDSGTDTLTGTISGTGSFVKSGSGTIVLNNSAANTFSGGFSISSGKVKIFNDNNLGNASNNVFFSGVGTLELSNVSSSRGISLFNTATLFTDDGTVNSWNGTISGMSPLIKDGDGKLILTSPNPYSGGTEINGGILEVALDTYLGGGDLSFDGGTLEVPANFTSIKAIDLVGIGTIQTDSGNSTINGAISGSGELIKTGSGTLILTNAGNNYTGGTQLRDGVVKITTAANIGSSASKLSFDGGTLELAGNVISAQPVSMLSTGIFQADVGTSSIFSGSIDGVGSLVLNGLGSLAITGTNTYIGGTSINGGTLIIANDANLGAESGALTFNGGMLKISGNVINLSRSIILSSNATIQADVGTKSRFGGIISGNGSFALQGGGSLALQGINTYLGNTSISGGSTLQIIDDVNLGSRNANLAINDGTLEFQASMESNRLINMTTQGIFKADAGTSNVLNGVISGAGVFVKSGAGAISLTAANTYSLGTTIEKGTLKIAADANLGQALQSLTFDGGTLEIERSLTTNRPIAFNNTGTFLIDAGMNATLGGILAGTGGLIKQGLGSLTLTNANTYGGTTSINLGSLFVDGSLSSSGLTIVNSQGLLGGNGTLGNVDVYGTVSPGHSIGTLHVNNLTFFSGSTYLVEINGALSDQIIATGNVVLNSKASVVANPSQSTQSSYTIIQAGGTVSNHFAPIENMFPRYVMSLQYLPQQVVLQIIGGIPFPDILVDGDSHSIAECFQTMVDDPSINLQSVLNILNGLTFLELSDAFDQFNPGLFNAVNYSQEGVLQRIREVYTRHANHCYSTNCSEWGPHFPGRVWTSFLVDGSHQSEEGSTRAFGGYKDKFLGVVTGIDYLLNSSWSLSCGFAYVRSLLNWTGNQAKAGSNSYNFTAASSYNLCPFIFDASIGYTFTNTQAHRNIYVNTTIPSIDVNPAINSRVSHRNNSNAVTAHTGIRVERDLPLFNVDTSWAPFANLDYTYVSQGSFNEAGGGLLNLFIDGQSSDLLRPEFGFSFHMESSQSAWNLMADISLSYVNESRFMGRTTTASFAASSDCKFQVEGLFPHRNLICPALKLGLCTEDNFSLYVGYRGEYGSRYCENEGTFELRIFW